MLNIKKYHIFWRSQSVSYKIIMIFCYLIFWLFGLTPFANVYFIYQLYIVLWFLGITKICYWAINMHFTNDEDDLNGLVSSILFISHVAGHLAVLLDSWMMRDYRSPLYAKFEKLKRILRQNLSMPLHNRSIDTNVKYFSVLYVSLVTVGHALIIWTTFKTKSDAGNLYWFSLPSYLALQFKTLEFLLPMIRINYYTSIIRRNINDMGERNLKRMFNIPSNLLAKPRKAKFIKVLSRRQEQEDEKQVEVLKLCYNEIFAMFQLLNGAYGWSLLAITAVYFVDFVCNCYWILLSVITQGRNYFSLLQNACFALLAFIILSLMCWLCEKTYYEVLLYIINLKKKTETQIYILSKYLSTFLPLQSRYIGCLISKLVKQPLGNKRYNDLVSEFSVQTLHQRFIITAKEFFSLNLGLLGSVSKPAMRNDSISK